jgi:hypothetical protein
MNLLLLESGIALDDTIVKILGFGISGLSFLLVFMAFLLLRKEQDKPQPRNMILKTIWMFMGLCLIMSAAVGIFSLMEIQLASKAKAETAQALEVKKHIGAASDSISSVLNADTIDRDKLLAISTDLKEGLSHMDTLATLSEPASENTAATKQVRLALERDIDVIQKPDQNADTLRSALTRIRIQSKVLQSRTVKLQP